MKMSAPLTSQEFTCLREGENISVAPFFDAGQAQGAHDQHPVDERDQQGQRRRPPKFKLLPSQCCRAYSSAPTSRSPARRG